MVAGLVMMVGCNSCSQPQQEFPEGCAHPCLAVIVLPPPWCPLWLSTEAQLTVCFALGEAAQDSREQEQGDAVTPELLLLVSLLPFIQPQPSAQSRMEGGQLLPLRWEGQEAMTRLGKDTGDEADGCILPFRVLGAALAWCPWGLWRRHSPSSSASTSP